MAASLTQLINELSRLYNDDVFTLILPFIISQLVSNANTNAPSVTNQPQDRAAQNQPVVPQALADPRSEALRAAIDATQSEIDKHLRHAETNIYAANGNMQTLQKELEETGIIASLSGHTANLQREHAAEYKQMLAAKAQKEFLSLIKDGNQNDPDEPSLSLVQKLHAEGKLGEASNALTKLNEKLTSSAIKIDNKQYVDALKSAQEEYKTINSRIENAETAARVARDGSVMLGAIAATGGGAGLAGLGVVSAGAVASNVTEQVGHVTLGNKSSAQATQNGLKQLGNDAITIGATIAGIKGATSVASAGMGLAATATGLAGVGASTSVVAEASQLGLQIALGEKESMTSNDMKELAIGAIGGAAGSLVGFGGGIGRTAVSGIMQKSGMFVAETAADVAVTTAEELTRAKIQGREISSETVQQAGLNSLRSLVIGEFGAYARNHSSSTTIPTSNNTTTNPDQPVNVDTTPEVKTSLQTTTTKDTARTDSSIPQHPQASATTPISQPNTPASNLEAQPTTPTRRRVDEIADSLTKVNRQQIGNVHEIIANRDIIRDSEMDEIVTNQKNYAHGSAAVTQDILSRSGNTDPTALVYYEGKELRTVNQLNHGAGDAYIRATNNAVREAWSEINPQAQVFRGPNAAIIVSVPYMTAKDALAYHKQVQSKVQQHLTDSPEMRDKLAASGVQLSGELRAGGSEIATANITSADSAKLSYYRALAEAGAAAEYEKQISGNKPLSIAEIAAQQHTDIDSVLRSNFNFIPPEAQPGTFFKIHEQKQTMQQSWDALVGPVKSFLDTTSSIVSPARLQAAADKQRQAVASALEIGPTATTERSLHSAARIETVKYLAMTNRPGRFESNVQAVHDGIQVPIINTLSAERLQIDLLRNEIPVFRADGDADFLGPLFKNQQAELKNGKRELNKEIANADLRYGELFNNAATQLKFLENQINQARAATTDQTKPIEPILFTLAKQSNSDEFQLLVAGRNATPEHLKLAMQTVRNAFRDVGMQEPFAKVHKITGENLGFGGTTATIGTDYRSLNQAIGAVEQLPDTAIIEHLKVVGKVNDAITNLRKFTKLKDTSGDIAEITPEQFKEIQGTMRDFVGLYRDQVLKPALAQGENLTTIKAALQQVTNTKLSEANFQQRFATSTDAVRKGLNALNDVENTIAAFGTPHNPSLNLTLGQRGPNGAFGDVLQQNGFDVDRFRREIDELESSMKLMQSLSNSTGLFNRDADISLPAAEQLTGIALQNQLLRPPVVAILSEARDAQRILGKINEAMYLDEQINLLDPRRTIGRETIQRDKSVIQSIYDEPQSEVQNNANILTPSQAEQLNKYDPALGVYYTSDSSVEKQLLDFMRSSTTQKLRSIGRGGDISVESFALQNGKMMALNEQVSAIHTFIKPRSEDGSYTIIDGSPSGNGTRIYRNGRTEQASNHFKTIEAGATILLPHGSRLPTNLSPEEFRFVLPRNQTDVNSSPQRFRYISQAILDMPEHSVKVLGRAPSADIVVSNSDNANIEISRYHATVHREKDDTHGNRIYRVSDGIPASRNGTAVLQNNGTWLEVKGEQKVWPGDEIRLGNQLYFALPLAEASPNIAPSIPPQYSHGVIDIRSYQHQQRVAGRKDYSAPSESSPNGRLNNWRILGRNRPFDQGVYLGGGIRPAIVIDKQSDIALREFTEGFMQRAHKSGALHNESQLLVAAYSYVGRKIVNDSAADDKVMKHYNIAKDEEVLLGAYIDNRGGVCAHKSLILGSLLESLKNHGYLRGDISFERNQVVGQGAHAWIRYTTTDGRIIIADPTHYKFGELQNLDANRWVYERVHEL